MIDGAGAVAELLLAMPDLVPLRNAGWPWLGLIATSLFSVALLIRLQTLKDRIANSEAQVDFLIHRDPVTGLPNHLLARDRLDRLMSYASRGGSKVAVMVVTLDGMDGVKEALGRSCGDELLREAADRLNHCIRECDTVSRQSGNEFLILLGEVRDVEAAAGVAAKVLDAMRQISPEQPYLSVLPSVGIAMYPDDGADFDVLLGKANLAATEARRSGKDSYRFLTEHMNADAAFHSRTRNGLRRAIDRNELTLHYQPQFHIPTGTLVGAEALLRWNDPDRGLIAPNAFIPAAEQSGLIVPIGEWVLHEACRQAAEWQKQGEPLTVAVNISAVQFTRGSLESAVVKALDHSRLSPALLELELTESILLEDSEKTLRCVRRMGEQGLRFSIDDFGTGYSSLAYLKKFAVHKLKIDQSFVRDLRDEASVAIVRAIIQMARGLGLETIAEGIEDEWTLDFLRANDCGYAQGYFLGRPMTAEQFAQLVRDQARARQRADAVPGPLGICAAATA
ncbi:MAG TPA: bifunctional diguanylate cyclase/phosphodiesterase [Magnetospirillum sp.]|nr:bifunctional diguanylate cyclase/phosphodiesterase [Magnetospirillum sp.]